MASIDQRVVADTGIILAPTFRSRAYVQRLAQSGIAPAVALFLPGPEPNWDGEDTVDVSLSDDGIVFSFQPGVAASETIRSSGVPSIVFPDGDINGEGCRSVLSTQKVSTYIYSGTGGSILSKQTLSQGMSFLHVHGGYAPAYRGSTAFYYSILRERRFGATALWLNEGIDTGPIILRKSFPLPSGIDIDCVYDPATRAELLTEVLETKLSSGEFPKASLANEPGETYFVIHPVLKHLALRACGLVVHNQD